LSQFPWGACQRSIVFIHEQSWCKKEREYFMNSLETDPARARRMYAVLLDEHMRSQCEKEGLGAVLHFPFYDKDSATDRCMRLGGEGKVSPKFMERISALASDIAARIKELRAGALNGPFISQPPPPRHGTVVLSAVPGEIEDRRTELADFLVGPAGAQ
jgi:hypothetical protein